MTIEETSLRPLPDPRRADFAEFWQGARDGRLLLPQCARGHRNWPPRPACQTCHEPNTEWTELPRTGRVFSWTVVHRTRLPWFADRTPYPVVIATVTADPAIRLVARCDCDPAELTDGAEVHLSFEQVAPGVHLPLWTVLEEGQ